MKRFRETLASGTILKGRYRIEANIGSGGFAITYAATDIDKELKVAVKEFYPLDDSIDSEHEKIRFLKEAQILREFDYLEGLVSVRDVFEDNDTAYLVMDYIEGVSLKDYVKEYGSIAWDELIRMILPVMKSLAKIHRRNIIHYDISPDNLMIGLDNRLWLIDFGASLRCVANNDRTLIVKHGYAPVEQYYSDGSSYDGRIGPWTDVYALAATMYMALTGQKPENAVERLRRNDVGKADGVGHRVSGSESDAGNIMTSEKCVLGEVVEVWQRDALLRGMAVEKADRYSSMEEFIEAVSYPSRDNGEHTRIIYKKDYGDLNNRPSGKSISDKGKRYLLYVAVVLLAMLSGAAVYGVIDSKRDMRDPLTGEDGVIIDMEGAAEDNNKPETVERLQEEIKDNAVNNEYKEQGKTADVRTGKEEADNTEADTTGKEEADKIEDNATGKGDSGYGQKVDETDDRDKNSQTSGETNKSTESNNNNDDDDDELY